MQSWLSQMECGLNQRPRVVCAVSRTCRKHQCWVFLDRYEETKGGNIPDSGKEMSKEYASMSSLYDQMYIIVLNTTMEMTHRRFSHVSVLKFSYKSLNVMANCLECINRLLQSFFH